MATFISQMNKLHERAHFWGIDHNTVMETYQRYYKAGKPILKVELAKQFYAEFSTWLELFPYSEPFPLTDPMFVSTIFDKYANEQLVVKKLKQQIEQSNQQNERMNEQNADIILMKNKIIASMEKDMARGGVLSFSKNAIMEELARASQRNALQHVTQRELEDKCVQYERQVVELQQINKGLSDQMVILEKDNKGLLGKNKCLQNEIQRKDASLVAHKKRNAEEMMRWNKQYWTAEGQVNKAREQNAKKLKQTHHANVSAEQEQLEMDQPLGTTTALVPYSPYSPVFCHHGECAPHLRIQCPSSPCYNCGDSAHIMRECLGGCGTCGKLDHKKPACDLLDTGAVGSEESGDNVEKDQEMSSYSKIDLPRPDQQS